MVGVLTMLWGLCGGWASSSVLQGDGWRGSILLADHDRRSLIPAKAALVRAGFRVTVTTRGPRVLHHTRSCAYDAVVRAALCCVLHC